MSDPDYIALAQQHGFRRRDWDDRLSYQSNREQIESFARAVAAQAADTEREKLKFTFIEVLAHLRNQPDTKANRAVTSLVASSFAGWTELEPDPDYSHD